MTRAARQLVMDLKYPDSDRLKRVARWLASPDAMDHFSDFFGPTVDLVPAPGHAPLEPNARDRLSSAGELVNALVRAGLGRRRNWLQRDAKVKKSAWAGRGHRPTEQDHYRSISVHEWPVLGLDEARRITVVDDVITTGATLHACVRLITQSHPSAKILAFALVRTRSDLDQVEAPMEPVSDGTITLESDGQTSRTP